MAGKLTKAGDADLERILPLVAAFHEEAGFTLSDTHRRTALAPLLAGSPLGDIFFIGPSLSPIGYIAITHGYSIEFGGPDAFVDEFYLRPGVRGRGVGGEVLQAVSEELAKQGTKAIHLEVELNNPAANLYHRRGFKARDGYNLMTRTLS